MRYQEVTEARCYCYRTWKLLGMGLENGCFFLPGSGSRGPCRYDVHNRYIAVVHNAVPGSLAPVWRCAPAPCPPAPCRGWTREAARWVGQRTCRLGAG